MYKFFLSIHLMFIIFLILIICPDSSFHAYPEDQFTQFPHIVDMLNFKNIYHHMSFFSSYKSRFTGYEGFNFSQKYIEEYFNKLGLRIIKQPINVPIPVVKESWLKVIETREKINIYPLVPNLVCPPSAKLEGKIVYVRRSSIVELDGKVLNNSIALVDFNSKYDWINCFLYGAKAVIFIGNNVNRIEAEKKYLPYAANLPRYYVDIETGKKLIEYSYKNYTAKIYSEVVWKNVKVYNIIGILKGMMENEIIIYSAHYDSFSIIPQLSPGADEASSIAFLLEAARILSKSKPYRTIWFVALAAHYQGLLGAREFVEEFFFGKYSNMTGKDGVNVRVALGFDFSSDSDSLSIVAGGIFPGTFYGLPRIDKTIFNTISDLIFYRGEGGIQIGEQRIRDKSLLYYLIKYKGKKYRVGDGLRLSGNKYFIPLAASPIPLLLDSEALAIAGGFSLSLSTSNSLRLNWWTPKDTINNVFFENLKPQFEFSIVLSYFLANYKELSTKIPQCPVTKFMGAQGKGFITLYGRVVTYDLTLGTYVPVSNALVHLSSNLYKHDMLTFSDENGNFVFHGLSPSVLYLIEAYVVDNSTGNILYAPDYGEYGGKVLPLRWTTFIYPVHHVTTVVFKASTIVLAKLVYPRDISPRVFKITVNDVRSHTPTLKYGSNEIISTILFERKTAKAIPGLPIQYLDQPIDVAYIPPDTPVEIMINLGSNFIGVLNNKGKGYTLKYGGQIIVNVPFQMSLDLINIDEERLNELHLYNVFTGGFIAEKYHNKSVSSLKKSLLLLKSKIYSKSYVYAIRAWNLELRAYNEVKRAIYDTVVSAVFFAFILIPFAFFMERLTISSRGLRQVINTIAIYIVFTLLFISTHPGILIASNGFMILLTAGALILVTPVLGILLSESQERIKELRERLLGRHRAGISIASAASISFSYSTMGMRRRKTRTLLTLISLITVIFATTLLSSAYSYSIVMPLAQMGEKPPYQGIFIRHPERAAFSPYLYEFFKAWLSDKGEVSIRTWWFPMYLEKPEYRSEELNITVKALEGIDSSNAFYSEANKYIVPTNILTVLMKSKYGCIASNDIYNSSGLGGTILLPGNLNLTIIGYTLNEYNDLKDLDLEEITPVDPIILSTLGEEVQIYPHLHDSYLIVNKNITDLFEDSEIYIISIKLYNNTYASEVVGDIAEILGVDVYSGLGDKLIIYRQSVLFAFQGWQYLLVPMAIAMFTILNTMLGSIYERTKEIGILSSIGLSPSQVFFVFLTDAVVLGIVGSFLGYLLAVLYSKLTLITYLYQVSFNYTSSFVILVMGFAFLASFASSIYPAYKASKLVTPSLARKWKVPKPKGNIWEISLPFVSIEVEVKGVLAFMKEYFEAHRGERLGKFTVISDITYGEEEIAGNPVKKLLFTMQLAPYEQGITQKTELKAIWNPGMKRYVFQILMELVTGSRSIWINSAYSVVDDIRKQLLLWRTFKPEEKEKYISLAKKW
ncbi:MAG: hypothetical protein DRJ34_00060 [Thermoprotei archaeon]|nr:MAG: hypothetical protein DRJ34_00060 [Thermoprotei archaeon]